MERNLGSSISPVANFSDTFMKLQLGFDLLVSKWNQLYLMYKASYKEYIKIHLVFVRMAQVGHDHLQKIGRVGIWDIRQLIHKAEHIKKSKSVLSEQQVQTVWPQMHKL